MNLNVKLKTFAPKTVMTDSAKSNQNVLFIQNTNSLFGPLLVAAV
jgi:hypothetical protein